MKGVLPRQLGGVVLVFVILVFFSLLLFLRFVYHFSSAGLACWVFRYGRVEFAMGKDAV